MGPTRRIPQIGKMPHVRPGKVKKGSHRVQLESLAKGASLRTIGDWILLEYVLGEASLTSLRWGKMVHTTPRYHAVKVPEGTA